MGVEHPYDHQNSRETSPVMLHCGGTCDTNGVNISITHQKQYGRRVCRSGENDLVNLFSSPFLWIVKILSPIVGTLSTVLVKKSGLGLLNPVTSMKNKYLTLKTCSHRVDLSRDGGRRVFQRRPPSGAQDMFHN